MSISTSLLDMNSGEIPEIKTLIDPDSGFKTSLIRAEARMRFQVKASIDNTSNKHLCLQLWLDGKELL
jgi:hypothetical protein